MTRIVDRLLVVACLGAALTCQAQTSATTQNGITLAGSGYTEPHATLAVAPGQIITLHVYGLTVTTPTSVTATPTGSGLPHTLNGISVDLVQGTPAVTTSLELHALYQTLCAQPASCSNLTGITLQIPFALDVNFAANSSLFPVLELVRMELRWVG